jgi:putative inorganic carbon (hco3(-)) transporter
MRRVLRGNYAANQSESVRRSTVPVLLTLYVALLPVQFQVVEGFNFAPSDIFLLAYLLFQSNRLQFRKGAWSIWHAALLPMMILSAWIGLQQNGELTSYVVVNKLVGVLWLLVGYGVLSSEMSTAAAVRSLARTFVASVCALNILAIAGFCWPPLENMMPQLNYSAGERVAGLLIDPNAFGGLVLTALVLQAVTGLNKAPLFRDIAGPLICVSLSAGLALTFSRSAWIGLAAALVFLAVVRPIHGLKMAAAIVTSGLALLAYTAYRDFDHFYAMSIRPETIQSRIDDGGAALKGFLAHPIFGTGLGTFVFEHGIIIHNTYLWFLSECGVVGAIVVIGLTMWYFKVAIPVIRSSRGSQRALIVALAVAHAGMLGVSAGIEVFYQRHWWLVMAMIVACRTNFSRPQFVKVWFAPPPESLALSPVEFSANNGPFLRAD